MTMPEMRDPNWCPSPSHSHQASGSLELSTTRSAVARPANLARLWRRLGKIALFGASLYLFILAITVMKEGSRGVAPLIRHTFTVTNTANCLGFGWLFAYVVMGGSPVAAAALTFFDAGAVDKLGAFAMIAGSRFGASFVVLLIGFLYVLRGRDRVTSLSMGLLSLIVTATTYLPALIIGTILLQTGTLDMIQLHGGTLLQSIVEKAVEPIMAIVVTALPDWAAFLVGLGLILLSFSLFDKCLPQMTLKESQVGRMSRLVYRPWVMFILGALITLFSMSVSLSLSILVPMSARGFIRRENVIPYIMGANITTFVDTLLAAVLLNNPLAFTIVNVGMITITLVSIVTLFTAYNSYRRVVLGLVAWVTASSRNLALFMAALFAVPITLMIV